MKNEKSISSKIVANIVKIRRDRNIKQVTVATEIGIDPGTYSKIENGKIELTVDRLAEIANFFKLDLVDVIYWPYKYIRHDSLHTKERSDAQPKITIQIELDEEKKDKVLEMLFEGKDLKMLYDTEASRNNF